MFTKFPWKILSKMLLILFPPFKLTDLNLCTQPHFGFEKLTPFSKQKVDTAFQMKIWHHFPIEKLTPFSKLKVDTAFQMKILHNFPIEKLTSFSKRKVYTVPEIEKIILFSWNVASLEFINDWDCTLKQFDCILISWCIVEKLVRRGSMLLRN